MELTGDAANRTMKGDEKSERRREESARGCSVRVERWVRPPGNWVCGERRMWSGVSGCVVVADLTGEDAEKATHAQQENAEVRYHREMLSQFCSETDCEEKKPDSFDYSDENAGSWRESHRAA